MNRNLSSTTRRVAPASDVSPDVRARRLGFMTWFVRIAGIYNASAVVILLTPGALDLVGVREPYSPFWVWLPALVGLFAGIVLLLSSMDLRTYGSFPYWNGIVRLVFVVATFSLDFGSDAPSLDSWHWVTCRSRSGPSSACRAQWAELTGNC